MQFLKLKVASQNLVLVYHTDIHPYQVCSLLCMAKHITHQNCFQMLLKVCIKHKTFVLLNSVTSEVILSVVICKYVLCGGGLDTSTIAFQVVEGDRKGTQCLRV
jgi:hypothetical protein